MTPRQWQDKWCAEAGHEAAAVVVKGRGTVLCLECDTYFNYKAALGQTAAKIAARHFSNN
jgi:hypothetical protein